MDEAAPAVEAKNDERVDGEAAAEEAKKDEGAPDAPDTSKEADASQPVGNTDDGLPSSATAPEEVSKTDDGLPSGATAPEDRKKPGAKTLEQMMSLKEGDDERTQISKKVSWILRHGARKVEIEIDIDGWVTLHSLLSSPVMAGVTEARLLDIVDESNLQKVRYEIKEAGPDDETIGKAIRAVSKHTIVGMAGTVAREQRRSDREQRRETRQEAKEKTQVEGTGSSGDAAGPDGGQPAGFGKGFDRGQDDQEMSFEQQMKEGFRPLYQGQRIVAMVKEGHQAVAPGRKGKGYGKENDRSYGSYGGRGGDSGGGGYGEQRGGRAPPGDFWSQKGDQRGSGKGGYWEDRGHGGQDYGKGGYGRDSGGKYGGKGYNDDNSFDRPRRSYNDQQQQHQQQQSTRQYWRVCDGQEAIMRTTEAMESQAVITLPQGTLVMQAGAEVRNQHGIVRMPVETLDGREHGWVTRTAEAAHGPAFFRPDVGPGGKGGKDRGSGGGKGGKGKGDARGFQDGGKGKGRSDFRQFNA